MRNSVILILLSLNQFSHIYVSLIIGALIVFLNLVYLFRLSLVLQYIEILTCLNKSSEANRTLNHRLLLSHIL
jgi:hypothetical protein